MSSLKHPDVDFLIEDSQRFLYRNGQWCTEHGMCVPHAESQRMTMRFYEMHGRSPRVEAPPPRATARRKKKSDPKADALRAAIARATAKKKSRKKSA